MLHSITMQSVGPAERLKIELAPRLNLIAGDNGLGKSFLLDVAWWVLARTWAGEPIRPFGLRRQTDPMMRPSQKGGRREGMKRKLPHAKVEFEVDTTRGGLRAYEIEFDRTTQEWKRGGGRPLSPGLVLYARVDGGFCVWDPARNYAKDALSQGGRDIERPSAFQFDTHSIWNGLRTPEDSVICKGFLQDWVEWQTTADPAFEQLTRVLKRLSPDEQDVPLRPGAPKRVSLHDVRDMPTLAMPYGDVPVLHASAAMRRVASLAYLLVWSFREHEKARTFLGRKPEHRIIFLIDEIEAHLHPRWQRVILPAMLEVTRGLAPRAKVQILATTHSPFVPLSVETLVDEHRDALWDLDLVQQKVTLTRRLWERRGDIEAWVTSALFDLKTGRSLEGEAVLKDVEAVYRRAHTKGEQVTPEELAAVEVRLRAQLPEFDPLLDRWREFKAHVLGKKAHEGR